MGSSAVPTILHAMAYCSDCEGTKGTEIFFAVSAEHAKAIVWGGGALILRGIQTQQRLVLFILLCTFTARGKLIRWYIFVVLPARCRCMYLVCRDFVCLTWCFNHSIDIQYVSTVGLYASLTFIVWRNFCFRRKLPPLCLISVMDGSVRMRQSNSQAMVPEWQRVAVPTVVGRAVSFVFFLSPCCVSFLFWCATTAGKRNCSWWGFSLICGALTTITHLAPAGTPLSVSLLLQNIFWVSLFSSLC